MNGKLQFQGEKTPSVPRKVAIIIWYLIAIGAAVWLWFLEGDYADHSGQIGRQLMLVACALIYVARAAYTLLFFVKRTVPWWEAAWGGGMIGFVLFMFVRHGLRAPQPLGYADGVALFIYLAGSYLGTASEHSRHIWKSLPENKGHLYTKGLFRYCRHINYLGDLLLFLGFAILTRQLWTGIVPLIMALNFVLILIPAHDAYLAMRYGAEFEEYARRSSKLVPFIY